MVMRPMWVAFPMYVLTKPGVPGVPLVLTSVTLSLYGTVTDIGATWAAPVMDGPKVLGGIRPSSSSTWN